MNLLAYVVEKGDVTLSDWLIGGGGSIAIILAGIGLLLFCERHERIGAVIVGALVIAAVVGVICGAYIGFKPPPVAAP